MPVERRSRSKSCFFMPKDPCCGILRSIPPFPPPIRGGGHQKKRGFLYSSNDFSKNRHTSSHSGIVIENNIKLEYPPFFPAARREKSLFGYFECQILPVERRSLSKSCFFMPIDPCCGILGSIPPFPPPIRGGGHQKNGDFFLFFTIFPLFF